MKDYREIIGKQVFCTVDRPLGSAHPRHPDLIYPLNYGYVKGILGGDGMEQDVYLMGVSEPVPYISAVVIAVYHRFDDIEDKWIAAPAGMQFTDREILDAIAFQERFFHGKLYRC